MIKIVNGQYVVDGAGVKIFRVFANNTVTLTDPFLLFDHFGSDISEDYINGFPWHPHRGIETVTYMLKGDVEHQDNLEHKGVIGPGDIQWMSAGSGIIHQEMPQGLNGLYGFQLWINMPSSKKMSAPKYRGIEKKEIKILKKNGVSIKVISGEYDAVIGPVRDLVIDVTYLDVSINKNKTFDYSPKKDYTTLCYIIEGSGKFLSQEVNINQLVLVKDVSKLIIIANNNLRFLLISGKPLNEPIAWGGPIVMNTQKELELAFKELKNGTFIKHSKKK